MRVLICGLGNCVGKAVARALRWRGHLVFEGAALGCGDARARDAYPPSPAGADAWATSLARLDVDAVVHCAAQAFAPREHPVGAGDEHAGTIALWQGAERAGIGRIVAVSMLAARGRRAAPSALADAPALSPADEAALGLAIDGAVVKTSLVLGPGSDDARALAALARAPLLLLPGGGRQQLQPLHVFELAECIVALLERTGRAQGVYELGGATTVSYRCLLETLRTAQDLGAAARVTMPLALARAAAVLAGDRFQGTTAAALLRFLAGAMAPARNAAHVLLGRAPSTLAEALAVTPPHAPARRRHDRRPRWPSGAHHFGDRGLP